MTQKYKYVCMGCGVQTTRIEKTSTRWKVEDGKPKHFCSAELGWNPAEKRTAEQPAPQEATPKRQELTINNVAKIKTSRDHDLKTHATKVNVTITVDVDKELAAKLDEMAEKQATWSLTFTATSTQLEMVIEDVEASAPGDDGKGEVAASTRMITEGKTKKIPTKA